MEAKPLEINLKRILNDRMPPKVRRVVPGALISALERLVRQEELNGILARTFPAEGSEFARAALKDLDITVDIEGEENIPAEGRFVFASNHPLGGLDGIALIAFLGGRYGDDNVRFLVNDMLMNVRPLAPVFLPINKYGSQGRDAARAINETYESDKQILIFPAGLVSRLQGKEIKDLEWHKAFVVKAIQSRRDVIPVRFHGENSRKFYRTALWRKRLHIPVNLEQALLPSELCAAKGSRFRIVIGKPISWEKLKTTGKSPAELAEAVKRIVYSL